MDLLYRFFDRAAFDQIWELPWPEFQRRWNSGPWYRKPLRDRGGYSGESLRGLIAFCVEPEPSDKEIEDILNRRTVRWTVTHSGSQHYFLEEIISNVPRLRHKQFSAVVFADSDFVVLLSAAVDAYLNRRIPRRTLRAVLALHTVSDLNQFLAFTRAECQALGNLMQAQPDMFRPIYRWQGPQAFEGEEWVSCLREADTRRFATFVLEAWQHNSPVLRLKDSSRLSFSPVRGESGRFRDFAISKELTRTIKRGIRRLKRPCVVRSWS